MASPASPPGVQLDADVNLHIAPAQPGSAIALEVPPGEYVAWFSALAETSLRNRSKITLRNLQIEKRAWSSAASSVRAGVAALVGKVIPDQADNVY